MSPNDPVVILFYKFTPLADPAAFAEAHRQKAKELGLLGRMIVAEEGVNATFEGTRADIESYTAFVFADERFNGMKIKESAGTGAAFPKLSIKVRKEIVTLGAGRFDPATETATELPASVLQKWYETGEDFVVLDLRNDFEVRSGRFDKTVNPELTHFRDLPGKLETMKDLKNKKVVAVCTGGIRCEKATCLLKREGFTDIYQLKDGIHTYMEEYPGEHFKGTLFVFDDRMTTRVVAASSGEVVGVCTFCNMATERYCCDDSVRPSKKLLCCEPCFASGSHNLRRAVSAPASFGRCEQAS